MFLLLNLNIGSCGPGLYSYLSIYNHLNHYFKNKKATKHGTQLRSTIKCVGFRAQKIHITVFVKYILFWMPQK